MPRKTRMLGRESARRSFRVPLRSVNVPAKILKIAGDLMAVGRRDCYHAQQKNGCQKQPIGIQGPTPAVSGCGVECRIAECHDFLTPLLREGKWYMHVAGSGFLRSPKLFKQMCLSHVLKSVS